MTDSAGNNGDDDLQSEKKRADFEKRLRQLDNSISKARDKEESKISKPLDTSGAYSYAFRIAAEMVAGPAVGAFLGWWLDRALGTTPIFLLILLVLGMVAGIRTVMRTANEMQKKKRNSRENDIEIK
ncbi:MAG: AtpZ/AtpI family protein [Methyloligellaceae bacterium]